MKARQAKAILFVVLAACGGGSSGRSSGSAFRSGTTCGVAVTISGAASGAIKASDNPACLSQLSFGPGLDVAYLLPGAKDLKSIELRVTGVRAGETGTFLADLGLKHADDRAWQAKGCMVTIAENRDVGPSELNGERYHVEGKGSCPMPASDGMGGSVTLGEFSFVAEISWNGGAAVDAG
ncbi:MAG TPA: hypothetical protein VHM19_21300 [Polyangiales bacterium]|jgi:hypothetical protein|nr:hypothetical protein [Polyangiales bacterium]